MATLNSHWTGRQMANELSHEADGKRTIGAKEIGHIYHDRRQPL